MSVFLLKFLGRDLNRDNLLKIARAIADARHVKLDRLAKRTKEMLVVWLCENALDIIQNPGAPPVPDALRDIGHPPPPAPDPDPPRPKPTPFPSLAAIEHGGEGRPDCTDWRLLLSL
jgi:hypothetical protein